jgi:transcriptional regulator with XRE-family HTH domain
MARRDWIADCCQRHGISKSELARRLGVSRQAVGNYSMRDHRPIIDTIERVAKAAAGIHWRDEVSAIAATISKNQER